MLSDSIALTSILVATAAMLGTFWQAIVAKRAVQAQVMLGIEQHSINVDFSCGMDLIAELLPYSDYDAFLAAVSKSDRRAIYQAVSFLNFCAHVSNKGLVARQAVWDIYFWSYKVCDEKLPSWWLEGVRRSNPRRFLTFQAMCIEIARIPASDIDRFDQRRGVSVSMSKGATN
jgi:hypothetical protein